MHGVHARRRALRNCCRGFSLPEVMVAAFVMAVVLLPVLLMFMSSTSGAGQDVRELKAALLAQEVLEGVISSSRNLPELHAMPPENETGPGTGEVDVDALWDGHASEEGTPLYMGKCGPRLTRMFLSPKQPMFHRFLSIAPEKVGKERGTAIVTPVLWRVTARVHYTTPSAARDVEKDLVLSTFVYMDPTSNIRDDEDPL